MAHATIVFDPPVEVGSSPIIHFTATSSPGNVSLTAPTSPMVVYGLTSGVEYSFTVTATNSNGTGPASDPSNFFTPPMPTYSLIADLLTVDEGNAVVVSLLTTQIDDGELVPYTISDITSADIGGASLTGNFTVSNNISSVTLNVTADGLLEGAETLSLVVNSSNVAVQINDTSTSMDFTNSSITTIPFGVDNGPGLMSNGILLAPFGIDNGPGMMSNGILSAPFVLTN